MKKKTHSLALCGLLAALATAMMCLGTLIPAATFCCPMLASILLIAVADLCGIRYAFCWWCTVSLLSVLLAPDREAALLFLLLGWYPLCKPALDRLPFRVLGIIVKLLIFCAACALLLLLLSLLGMETVLSELAGRSLAVILAAVFSALGIAVFFLYDRLLVVMTRLWQNRWRKKLLRGE